MQLNCRILDSRLIYHDEDTLTGSESVVGEDTDTVMKLKADSDKSKNSFKKFMNNIYLISTIQN